MSLLSRIAGGDENALRTCIREHQPLVRALARRMVRAADVDDAVQDIFFELWRAAPRYDARVSERSFVAMLARRRLIDRVRRAARRPRTEPLVAPTLCAGASDRIEACSEMAFAEKHLRSLRPAQRNVLLLSALAGLSHREIATRLDMPLGTVKAHARRGMDSLRRSFVNERAPRRR